MPQRGLDVVDLAGGRGLPLLRTSTPTTTNPSGTQRSASAGAVTNPPSRADSWNDASSTALTGPGRDPADCGLRLVFVAAERGSAVEHHGGERPSPVSNA